MKKFFFSLACLILAAVSLEAATEYNKYGMKLAQRDGEYVVVGAKTYKEMYGLNVKKLPDLKVPYKPEITCYDKASIKSVKTQDVVYKTSKFGEDLHLMVFPASVPDAPVAFFIHGGGWVGGSYKSSTNFFKTLAGKYGVTVVSIEYTFATVEGATIGDSTQDCYDAVEFILKDAAKWGVNPERIGFFGSSAGGHLSAMCALHFPQTKAYVGYYGAYDLIRTMDVYAPVDKGEKHTKYNCFLQNWDPAYMKEYSPLFIARQKSQIPFNTILFAGTADITIGYQNAPDFRDALQAAGGKAELCAYENITHSMFKAECANDIYNKTIAFFTENL